MQNYLIFKQKAISENNNHNTASLPCGVFGGPIILSTPSFYLHFTVSLFKSLPSLTSGLSVNKLCRLAPPYLKQYLLFIRNKRKNPQEILYSPRRLYTVAFMIAFFIPSRSYSQVRCLKRQIYIVYVCLLRKAPAAYLQGLKRSLKMKKLFLFWIILYAIIVQMQQAISESLVC